MHTLMKKRVSPSQIDGSSRFGLVARREQFQDGHQIPLGAMQEFNVGFARFLQDNQRNGHGLKCCDPRALVGGSSLIGVMRN